MNNKPKQPEPGLDSLTLIVLLIGAIGSLSFMFIAGRSNKSVLLMGLFTVWVVSPYIGLLMANAKSFISPGRLWYLISFIVAGSLIIYAIGRLSPGRTPAFIFLSVPFLSWLTIILFALIAKKKDHTNS